MKNKEPRPERSNEAIAMRVSIHSIFINLFLSFIKMMAGIFGNSTAMLADAAHSLSDVITTFVVMIGVKLANKTADDDHPYGHERFECVAAIILSMVLLFTGGGIGWLGIQRIFAWEEGNLAAPGVIALVAAGVTIVGKESMYWYKRAAAKKINSGALMADAWHHRSDALSSVGSFIGIFGARIGFPILDPIAAIVICLFILKVAFDIFRDAIGKMTDKACDEETEKQIRDIILAQEAVLGIDLFKSRQFGDRIYVDVEIRVDASKSINCGHEISHTVHDAVETGFTKVKHCSIHINPFVVEQ
ncbi:MAG: cation diffusion facilitator family transporter [Lachnospiraceae bacterium]|jgi:cation diffusion facilitator family transporter|nr:cation diffusion facilitator family transporter [Lachnospiraceae bacterium]